MMNRRQFYQNSLITALISLLPKHALSELSPKLFEIEDMETALQYLYDDHHLIDSNFVHLQIPNRPESGALVPVTLSCELPNVRSMSLFALKNPIPLIAQFPSNPLIQNRFSLRIKLHQSTEVIAVAAADKLYVNRQSVTVTIGSCAA